MNNHKENIVIINKVKNYIAENLGSDMPLSKLAQIANFSPFHFQRLFKSIVNETPKQYIKRLRLEAAAHYIVLNDDTTILKVALLYGFTSLEAFSRAFKNYYGLSPDNFRREKEDNIMSILQTKTNLDQHQGIDHTAFISDFIDKDSLELEIDITKTSPAKIIYIPITLGKFETLDNSFKTIKNWAGARGIITPRSEVFGLMKDFPAFTALDKCRFQTCVSVDELPEVAGEIMSMELPSLVCATFKVYGGIHEIIKAIMWVKTHWLPDKGYKIRHFPVKLIPLSDPTHSHLHNISYQIYLAIDPK